MRNEASEIENLLESLEEEAIEEVTPIPLLQALTAASTFKWDCEDHCCGPNLFVF